MNGLLITGFWNSGTTLLVDLLRKHPQLQLTRGRWLPNLEERSTRRWLKDGFIQLGDAYQPILEGGWEAHQEPDLSAPEIRDFRRKFGWTFWTLPRKQLLSKNPWWFFVPELFQKVFTNDDMKYLIVFREGIHQVVSKHYWQKGPLSEEEMLICRAKFWAMCVDYYESHWHGREDVLTLDYAQICANPSAEISRICSHLDLDCTSLLPRLPSTLENRTAHWDNLDARLQSIVLEIVSPAQQKLDKLIADS